MGKDAAIQGEFENRRSNQQDRQKLSASNAHKKSPAETSPTSPSHRSHYLAGLLKLIQAKSPSQGNRLDLAKKFRPTYNQERINHG